MKSIIENLKIKKISRLLRINPQFFFDLLIYHASKLFRPNINDNLIIIGSSNGQAFIGNPKYLYQYIIKNTKYEVLVFVKSNKLKQELEQEGIKTVNNYSIKAIRLLRKARAVFVSHGYHDILPVKFAPRTVVIQTWHGADVKIIGKHPYVTKYINSKWSALARLKIRYYQFFDYVITPSSERRPKEIAAKSFNFPIERILSIGYPRNDILFTKDNIFIKNLREYYKIPINIKRVVLYAPTYREVFTTRNPFTGEDLRQLSDLCKETKTIFLMKAHIDEEIISIDDLDNIITVRKDSDIQELLLLTDILITDYSSVYCDYLLLNRPVLLYTYDYEEYVSQRGIFYDHLEEIAPGPILYTFDELLNALQNINDIKEKYQSKSIEIRNYFNKYIDGNSSERLLQFLKLI